MKTGPHNSTLAIEIRDRLRSDILNARFAPGQRLTFAELSERYGVSVHVTREALTWLSSQGLVQANAHQGFAVTSPTLESLNELTQARLLIEPLVLELSISAGDTRWEGEILAAHHVLTRTPRPDDASEQDEWARAHTAFHDSLYSACTNQRLLGIVRAMSEEVTLYRRWASSLGNVDPVASTEHQELLDACLARDAATATAVLGRYIDHTREAVERVLGELSGTRSA